MTFNVSKRKSFFFGTKKRKKNQHTSNMNNDYYAFLNEKRHIMICTRCECVFVCVWNYVENFYVEKKANIWMQRKNCIHMGKYATRALLTFFSPKHEVILRVLTREKKMVWSRQLVWSMVIVCIYMCAKWNKKEIFSHSAFLRFCFFSRIFGKQNRQKK